MGEGPAGETVTACARESRAVAEARAYRAALAPGGSLLCAVASLDVSGGLSYLIAAMKDLPDVRAVCLGEGRGWERWERQIEEAELEHRVGLLALPSGCERWRALHASDLLVLPALKTSTLGREALAEAQRWGRAVVATEAYGFARQSPTLPEAVVVERESVAGLVRGIRQQLASHRA